MLIMLKSVLLYSSHPAFKIEREKDQSITRVLGISSRVTRESLHSELRSLEVLSNVPPELAELYTVLESEFHPLDMVSRVQNSLRFIENTQEYAKYVPQLRRMLLLRS